MEIKCKTIKILGDFVKAIVRAIKMLYFDNMEYYMELYTKEKISLKNRSVFQKLNDGTYFIKDMLTVQLEEKADGGILLILSGNENVLTEKELKKEIFLLLENCFHVKKNSLKIVKDLIFSENKKAEGA